ncbi:MAG: hypothetical protein NWE89_15745 [Candidatus Bathyarchaeota archaeon]|nr:hypothetical protein [Candidatus Bathyarchaeota archaeon]
MSTFFAEVVSGSDIFPFYNIVSYLLVIPLYTLHTLVLWTYVARRGKLWLYALFPAGCIFGLYEAYITKVLWNPTWESSLPRPFGIAVIETFVLVPYWHTFMSFIIPLLVAESTLTSSNEIYSLLPEWSRRIVDKATHTPMLYILPFLGGIFQSNGAATLNEAIASGLTTSLYLAALIYLWRRRVGRVYSMRSLLPDERQFRTLIGVLGAFYIVTGFILRPEELPGIGPQAAIWVLYVFFAALLVKGTEKSNTVQPSTYTLKLEPSILKIILLGALMSIGSALSKATGLGGVLMILVWFGGVVIGGVMIIQTVKKLFMVKENVNVEV